MKILVTGGTGYIGSHTCINLLELSARANIDQLMQTAFACINFEVCEKTLTK